MSSYEHARARSGPTHDLGAARADAHASNAPAPGKLTLVDPAIEGGVVQRKARGGGGAASPPGAARPSGASFLDAFRPPALPGAPIQRKVEAGAEHADGESAAAAIAAAPSGGGSPLPDELREHMEESFQTGFGDVRVYQGDQAAALGARAFARGSELHFAPGEYDPGSAAGRALIGHELAHVVQQRGGRVAGEQAYGGLINADPGLEREADEAGARAAHGEPAGLSGGSGPAPAGPIQRAIRIGKNQTAKPLTTWEAFLEKLPRDNKTKELLKLSVELLTYQPQITELLRDDTVHPFDSFQHLLAHLKGPSKGPSGSSHSNLIDDTDEHSSRCQVLDCKSAAIKLANVEGRNLLLFDPRDPVESVKLGLARGKVLVICSDHAVDRRSLGKAFGELCSQVIFVDTDSMMFVTLWLAMRHHIDVGINATAINSWLSHDELVIGQSPQMRGDMHDVLPALALEPNLKVALCVTKASGYVDADIILGYYSSYRQRVAVCPFAISGLKSLGGKCKKIGWATEILCQAVKRDPVGARKTITDETTGHPTEDDNEAYAQVCQGLGFLPGVPYMIINYRDSGHKPGKDRESSHPELDTGTEGLKQMMGCVMKLGFVPVPMGQPPGMTKSTWQGPHLIEYWSFPCCKETLTRNKRQTEYGLLRYIAEHFNVRALAMRSGGTDAMVYAGIETISLDLASSGKTDEQLERAQLGSKYQEGGNRSWMRAAVRDLIMPGKFHQGFFEDPRPDDGEYGDWKGAFSPQDVLRLSQTIRFFFGVGEDPMRGLLDLAPNNPLAHPQMFAALLAQRRSREDSQDFLQYVGEMNEARRELYESMVRDLPLELLRLEVRIVQLKLEILRLKIEKLKLLLKLEELQLLRMMRGLSLEESLGEPLDKTGTF